MVPANAVDAPSPGDLSLLMGVVLVVVYGWNHVAGR